MGELFRYGAVILSVIAGVRVLRNPLRVWPNTMAGVSYFAGAAAAVILGAWWPIIAGWGASLAFQG
ncbi:MAG: hypothetical protein ACREL7_08690, partial [Longimicrobiales bacterium]